MNIIGFMLGFIIGLCVLTKFGIIGIVVLLGIFAIFIIFGLLPCYLLDFYEWSKPIDKKKSLPKWIYNIWG